MGLLVWRKRVGIEPTAAGFSQQPDGFEGRASHQARVASLGNRPQGYRTGSNKSKAPKGLIA